MVRTYHCFDFKENLKSNHSYIAIFIFVEKQNSSGFNCIAHLLQHKVKQHKEKLQTSRDDKTISFMSGLN